MHFSLASPGRHVYVRYVRNQTRPAWLLNTPPACLALAQTHIDPHIPMVPAWLLNFVLGVLAPYIFAQIQQVQ